MTILSPYEKCPVYETSSFIIRLIQVSDTEDLLECYSDFEAAKFFNVDNCWNDFMCHSFEEMKREIEYWLNEYRGGGFVRFSVVDKKKNKAIGTIEMFARPEVYDIYRKVGVLRIDLVSAYEKEEYISEILETTVDNFYDCFTVDHIITKAMPAAVNRISALNKARFIELNDNVIGPHNNYYFIK